MILLERIELQRGLGTWHFQEPTAVTKCLSGLWEGLAPNVRHRSAMYHREPPAESDSISLPQGLV